MGVNWLRKVLAVVLSLAVIQVSVSGCAASGEAAAGARPLEENLERIVAPYRFDLAAWEVSTLLDGAADAFTERAPENGTAVVKEYFALSDRVSRLQSEINAGKSGKTDAAGIEALDAELSRVIARQFAMEKQVSRVLGQQITEVMAEFGIYNPADVYFDLKLTFPPVNFLITDPPYLLVVSRRDRIETIKTVMLKNDLSLKDREALEAEAEKLGVSALVVKIGGVATYPSFVSNYGDLEWVIDTATEEWLHQYLTFRPLGFRYLLEIQGVSRNPDIAAIDETVASMAAKEIGEIVYNRYYRAPKDTAPEAEKGLDFNSEMREIRKTVDALLAESKVAEAEAFMETKRLYLAANGYYLRKLNQAYFAFNGSYTDSPTSVDPLGGQLREVRDGSDSLKAFLDKASFFVSREDVKQSLTAGGK